MKKILSLIIATIMLMSVSAFAVDVSYPASLTVDDFDSYTEGSVIPFGTSGDKWDDYADRGFDDSWLPLIGTDPTDSENKVLRMELKPTSNGTTRSLLTACPDVKGVITISFDMYVPYGEAIEGSDELYNNTQERTSFVTFSASSAGSATEILNARLWLSRVAGGTDRPKFDVGGTYYNLPGYNVWHSVKFVIDTNDKLTQYYLTGTAEPDVTKSFSTDDAFDFMRIYASPSILNQLFYIDNFNMSYVKNETIDENTINLTYDAPSFDLVNGEITVNGTVEPYFAQNVYADLYMESDLSTPVAQETVRVNEDGTFTVVIPTPDNVRGWARVVMSTDHITTEESQRTSRLFIASLDDEENMLRDFNAIPGEDNPETPEDETAGITGTLDGYLPMVLSEAEFASYEENKEFYKEYFMAKARENTAYSDLASIGTAFRSGQRVLAIINAENEAVIDLLDDAEYIEKENLSEEMQAEYVRIWNAYETPVVYEADIEERLVKINAVASVNCAKRSEIHDTLLTYKNVFSLTEEELNPEKKDPDIVCSALNDKNFNFPEDVRAAYLESLENTPETEEEKKPVGGGSGGGGGGSFGGGNKGGGNKVEADNKVVEENLPQVAPEDAVIPEVEEVKEVVFTDTENHWAKEFITELSALNIIKGYEDGSFKPDKAVTRAEFVKMIVELLDIPASTADFNDVTPGDWFYSYVGAASGAGLVNGDGKNFNPNAVITRQDAAVIICRALKISGDLNTEFTDAGEISDYANASVGALAELGIINGYEDNSVRPLNSITRGETAKILVNSNKLIKALEENN